MFDHHTLDLICRFSPFLYKLLFNLSIACFPLHQSEGAKFPPAVAVSRPKARVCHAMCRVASRVSLMSLSSDSFIDPFECSKCARGSLSVPAVFRMSSWRCESSLPAPESDWLLYSGLFCRNWNLQYRCYVMWQEGICCNIRCHL